MCKDYAHTKKNKSKKRLEMDSKPLWDVKNSKLAIWRPWWRRDMSRKIRANYSQQNADRRNYPYFVGQRS